MTRSAPLVYLITDRRMLKPASSETEFETLIKFIERAAAADVDLVQIRERDLSARDLYSLSETIAQIAQSYGVRVLVNDRADLAASAGIGVHLTTRSMTVAVIRKVFGARMMIGASTHTLEEAEAAQQQGANFIVFGPVFETESKKAFGPPVGLEALQAVTRRLSIPVLALGGIKLFNFQKALDAGAAGIAAISLFTEAEDIETVVRTIKRSA